MRPGKPGNEATINTSFFYPWACLTMSSLHCTQVYVFEGMAKNVTCLGFYDSGHYMYSGGEDCMARIWDLR